MSDTAHPYRYPAWPFMVLAIVLVMWLLAQGIFSAGAALHRTYFSNPDAVQALLDGPKITPRPLSAEITEKLSPGATDGIIAATTKGYALACASVPTLSATPTPYLLKLYTNGGIKRSTRIDESWSAFDAATQRCAR